MPRKHTALKDVLEEQGRRQDWLAARLGISTSMMSFIVLGQTPLHPGRAERIAEILSVPLALFYDMDRGRLRGVRQEVSTPGSEAGHLNNPFADPASGK